MPPDLVARAKSELLKARIDALAALPAELRGALAREAKDRIAQRSERRRLQVARALFVGQRLVIGDKPEEVAEKLKTSVGALRGFCSRWAVTLVQRAGFRRLHAWVADRHVTQLDKLAEDAGIPREKALERIISAAFADGAFVARRVVLPVKSLAERAAA